MSSEYENIDANRAITPSEGSPQRDLVIERLDALKASVTEMEEQASKSMRNRWETVVVAAGKVTGGALMIAAAVSFPQELGAGGFGAVFSLFGGGYFLKNGVGDFSELGSKFRRASTLTIQSERLRAELTNEYSEAIAAARFRALEQPQRLETQPKLP